MKKNNQLTTIIINIIIPTIILTKLSKEAYLGPVWGLVVALSFPLFGGLYELMVQKQKSPIAVIGFIGVLLSGIIGLMKFPPQWIAIKEAAIPLIIGLIVLVSTNKSWQLITKILYHRELFDIDTIDEILTQNNRQTELDKKLSRANLFLSFSFFLSSALNFILAKIIVHSQPGTTQFNEEIGRMTMLSFPVIAFPSMIIIGFVFKYIITSIKTMTKLSFNEMLAEKLRSGKQ
ncbi:MAG: VC0807 family protein [Paludibacteraceae bacterium]